MNRRGFLGGLLALCGLGTGGAAAKETPPRYRVKAVGPTTYTLPNCKDFRWHVVAMRDAAEQAIEAGLYRFAYEGPVLYSWTKK